MKEKQTGVAIVLAMSVVALAALAATAMAVSQSTWSRQVELTTDHAQALLIVNGGLNWSRAVLSDDSRTSNLDYQGEPWSLQLPPIPVESGTLSGHMEDQQGKFNLNNLVNDGKINNAQLAHFRRLLLILSLPAALADTLCDWIDSDSEMQSPDGAEDAYYLSLPTPHFSANRPLIDVNELSLVRGFDEEVRARLKPFVTALPKFTAVNVNTASPEVIYAIVNGLQLDDARAVIAQRERLHFFRNFSDFFNQLPTGMTVAGEDIAVNSNYFMVTINATINETQAHGYALLARTNNTNWPTVIWRKYL